MGLIFTPEETVRVVDPRHPLFDRTFPLIGIMNSSTRGRCCVVWIRPTIERHIPVSVTDREFDRAPLSPLPLSVPALQQFLHTYDWVSRVRKGARGHANSDLASADAAASMEDVIATSTRSGAPDVGTDLSE